MVQTPPRTHLPPSDLMGGSKDRENIKRWIPLSLQFCFLLFKNAVLTIPSHALTHEMISIASLFHPLVHFSQSFFFLKQKLQA